MNEIENGIKPLKHPDEDKDEELDNAEREPSAGIFIDQNSLQDPKRVVNSNFQLLERYYTQTLNESRLNSRATLAVAILGFLVILIGVALAFAGKTAVGTVSSIAGLVAEASTVLFFKNNQEQIVRVTEYHKKLVSTQYLLTAISLAGELDSLERTAETKKIILNLLFLSNLLHGSSSDHLLTDQITQPGNRLSTRLSSALKIKEQDIASPELESSAKAQPIK